MNIATMLPSKNDIAKALMQKVGKLPSMPVIAIKLLKMIRDENTSANDLTKVVETDPETTAKVLKIVNSASFGIRQKIASIPHAIVLLGFQEVYSIALDVCLYEQIAKHRSSNCFDKSLFWRHCLSVANLSKMIAKSVGYAYPEEAYAIGLLHDIGKMILDVYGNVTYCDIIKYAENRDGVLPEIEKELGGLSHDEVGGYLCAEWGLPDKFVLAILFHHNRFSELDLSKNEKKLIAIIALANFISWILGLSSVCLSRLPILQPEIDKILPFKKINFGAIINKVHKEIHDVAEFYNFSFPSLDQFRANLLEANLHLSNITSRHYYLQKITPATGLSHSNIKKSLLLPHRSLDPNEIIQMTLLAIHEDFHYENINFFKIDTEKRCLFLFESFGDRTSSQYQKFTIKISPHSKSIVKCLRDKIPVMLVGSTRDEAEILKNFGIKEMGLVPVCNNNKIFGILGFDNGKSGLPIAPCDLATISIGAIELGMALGNAKIFEEIKHIAYTDPLTKIRNRAYIDKILKENYEKAVGGEYIFSAGIIDVDYFKKINDNFGHPTGDLILKVLADTMGKLTRPTDCIGRFGGEEFVFILNQSNLTEAVHYAERLRKKIEALGKLLLKKIPNCPLTVSIGVATYHSGYNKVEDLIADADLALYKAKNGGRNLVMYSKAQERKIIPPSMEDLCPQKIQSL